MKVTTVVTVEQEIETSVATREPGTEEGRQTFQGFCCLLQVKHS